MKTSKYKSPSLFSELPLFFKAAIVLIAVVVLSAIGISVYNQLQVSIAHDCTVIDLQQQQLIKGSKNNVSTEIRYLIITDKETFISESSLLNKKFNNSDLFWHLKKDSTYDFKVCGIGKTLFTDYRNVLEVLKAQY